MKKNLLIALALPAVFAACSQEDIVSLENNSLNGLGTPAGKIDFVLNEGAESRLAWGTTGDPVWSSDDAFSLFWLGATGENKAGGVYKSATNALYQREEGEAFTSKNIVYVGKHVIVYPADYTHVSDQKVLVKVGAEQDASKALGLRSVYVSDLLSIEARPEDATKREEGKMYAGYAEPVVADVAALSSNMVLKLNFAMNDNINEVKIKSIVLESDKDVFAYDGYLTLDANNYMSLSPKTVGKTMTLVMPEGTKVTKNAPSYTAQISLLPPVASALSGAKYKIVVNTNFGFVTIDKAMLVTNNAGKYQIEAGTGYSAEAAEDITANTLLSFKTEFTDIANRAADNKDTEENEAELSYGKRFVRNVAVDMSTAEINGMKIATSQDLIDAYEVYDLLEKGKDDVVSFELVGEAWKTGATANTFDLNVAAAEAIAAHEFVTLTLAQACDTLALVNTENAFTAVPDLSKALGDNRAELFLNLGEGNWALNVKNAKIVNAYKEIHNYGNLTVTEAAVTPAGSTLNKVVCNDGIVTFNGKVNMPVAYKQTKDAKTIVGEDANLFLNAGGNISGEVDVDGKIATHGGLVEINADAKIAVAGSFLTATTGTVNNLGTITLEGTGTAQVTANQEGTAMGSIVLADRSSMTKVFNADKQGYIKWIYNENGTFTKELTDAFNCLTLKSNIKFNQNQVGNNVKHIEVAASKVTVLPYDTSYNSGELKLKLSSVFVNENNTLVIPVGTSITTDATVKNGDIEVYGSYIAGTETGNGTIYYFNGQVNVATETALNEAIKNKAEVIVLTEDVVLSDALVFPSTSKSALQKFTLNLNGKTITSSKKTVYDKTVPAAERVSALISVKEGVELTIVNGTVDCTGTEDYAVETRGGNLIIKSGTYKGIVTAVYNNGGTVEIEGGEFSVLNHVTSEFHSKYLLNIKDKKAIANCFVVKGGTFHRFNPAVAESETTNPYNFVANGFEIVNVYNHNSNLDRTEAIKGLCYTQTWKDDITYKVGAIVANN